MIFEAHIWSVDTIWQVKTLSPIISAHYQHSDDGGTVPQMLRWDDLQSLSVRNSVEGCGFGVCQWSKCVCVYTVCKPNINRQEVEEQRPEGDYREIKKGMWDLIHCYTAVPWVSTHREKAKKRQAFLATPHYTAHRLGATDAILLPSGLNQTLNSSSTVIKSRPSDPRTATNSAHSPSSPSTSSTAPGNGWLFTKYILP